MHEVEGAVVRVSAWRRHGWACDGSLVRTVTSRPKIGASVAFVGDTDPTHPNSAKLMRLLAQRGVDAVIHQGDLTYVLPTTSTCLPVRVHTPLRCAQVQAHEPCQVGPLDWRHSRPPHTAVCQLRAFKARPWSGGLVGDLSSGCRCRMLRQAWARYDLLAQRPAHRVLLGAVARRWQRRGTP